MDLRTLTKLILKLAGLYYLASSLIGAMGIVANPVPNAIPWYVATYSMYLLLGAALFWFPGTIVNHVLRIKGAELEGALTASKLLEVGLALLGAYFSVAGAYACVYIFARAKWFYRFSDTFAATRSPEFGPNDFAAVVAGIVELAIGLALWFGRHKLVNVGGGYDRDR